MSQTSQATLTPAGQRLLPLLLFAAGFLVYLNALGADFVFDDRPHVLEDPYVRRIYPLQEYLASGRRGLVKLSFAVTRQFASQEPWAFHLGNVLVHLLAGLALYGLVRRTLALPRLRDKIGRAGPYVACATALLWLIHPLQTQAVTYVVQRSESMMGLFFLLLLYCAARSHDGPRWLWWPLALLNLAAGMLCKEVMYIAPLVLWLYDRSFMAGSFLAALRQRWPLYLSVLVIWLLPVVTSDFGELVSGSTGVGLGITAQPPATQPEVIEPAELPAPPPSSTAHRLVTAAQQRVLPYLMTQPAVILHYLRLSFWPHPLVIDYHWPLMAHVYAWHVAAIAVLLALTLWSLARVPWLGFLLALFFLTLAPSSSFLPIVDVAFEHRMYLALAPVILLVLLALRRLLKQAEAQWPQLAPQHAAVALGLLVLVSVALAARTVARNADYASEAAIWLSVVQHQPRNPRAHLNAGAAVYDEARHVSEPRQSQAVARAVAHYETAAALRPSWADPHNNLGTIYFRAGRMDMAERHYRAAHRLNPDDAWVLYNLGKVALEKNDLEQALELFRRAIERRTWHTAARDNYGVVLARLGRLEEAEQTFRDALALHPGYLNYYNNLAQVLLTQGRTPEAIDLYRQAQQIAPDSATTANNFGQALARRGDMVAAAEQFRRAARLNPGSAAAHFNLAAALMLLDQPAEAIEAYRAGLQANPQAHGIRRGLAWLLATADDPALRHPREALALARQAAQVAGDEPAHLETLAAALAANGAFEEAAAAQQRAIELAQPHADEPALAAMQRRLDLFRNRKAYAERPRPIGR